MKAQPVTGSCFGYVAGDRVKAIAWRDVMWPRGFISGTVTRTGVRTIQIAFDNGDELTIDNEAALRVRRIERLESGEDW